MRLAELVTSLATKTSVAFRPAAAADLEQLAKLSVPAPFLEFYRAHEPADCAELDGVRLWPAAEILRENKDFVPGAYLSPHGYVVCATNEFGDAYCIDLRDSSVVLLPHEIDFSSMPVERIHGIRKPIAEGWWAFLELFESASLEQEPNYE